MSKIAISIPNTYWIHSKVNVHAVREFIKSLTNIIVSFYNLFSDQVLIKTHICFFQDLKAC